MAPTDPTGAFADRRPYVTRPTRLTVFLRTFVPWQAWRFLRINLRMFGIIRRRPH